MEASFALNIKFQYRTSTRKNMNSIPFDVALLISVFQYALIFNYLFIALYSFIYFYRLTFSNPNYWNILKLGAIIPIALIDRLLAQFSISGNIYLLLLLILFALSSYLLVPLLSNLNQIQNAMAEAFQSSIKLKQFNKLSYEGLLLIHLSDSDLEQCKLIDCNNVVLDLTGFSKQELFDNPLVLFTPEIIKLLKTHILSRSNEPLVTSIKNVEQKLIPIELQLHYFTLGKLNYAVLSILDISDKVRLRKLLSEVAQNLEDQFSNLHQLQSNIDKKISSNSQILKYSIDEDFELLEEYLNEPLLLEALDSTIKDTSQFLKK